MTNILTKFHDYRTKNVASRAYTKVFLPFDLVVQFLNWHDPFSISSEILPLHILTKFHDYQTECGL